MGDRDRAPARQAPGGCCWSARTSRQRSCPRRWPRKCSTYAGWHFDGDQPIALFLHRISPARQTLDYGKTPPRHRLVGGERRRRGARRRSAEPWIKRATALDPRQEAAAAAARSRRQAGHVPGRCLRGDGRRLQHRERQRPVSGPVTAGVLRRAPQDPRGHEEGRAWSRRALAILLHVAAASSSRTNPRSPPAGACSTSRAAS